jgi:hypothetical protein
MACEMLASLLLDVGVNQRVSATEQLALAAAAAEKIGRVRLASEATIALVSITGDPAQRTLPPRSRRNSRPAPTGASG